jgi:hypothetical protein
VVLKRLLHLALLLLLLLRLLLRLLLELGSTHAAALLARL